LHPSGRSGIPFGHSSVSNIRPDDENFPSRPPLVCLEASNSSSFHLSEPSSEFEKIHCFNESIRTTWLYRPNAIQCLTSIRISASRHSYGKTAATVRTMSFIREVVYTKFNRQDVSFHGPNDQASYMEIACTNSTVRTSVFRVWMLKALLW